MPEMFAAQGIQLGGDAVIPAVTDMLVAVIHEYGVLARFGRSTIRVAARTRGQSRQSLVATSINFNHLFSLVITFARIERNG